MKKSLFIVFAITLLSGCTLSAMQVDAVAKDSFTQDDADQFASTLRVLNTFDVASQDHVTKYFGPLHTAKVIADGINSAQRSGGIIVPFGEDLSNEFIATAGQPYTEDQIKRLMRTTDNATYALGFAQALRLMAQAVIISADKQ